MTTATEVAARVRAGFAGVIVGNEEPIFATLVALLAGGHLLLEGVPGTAKTLIVRTLARLLGLEFRRIQFTPDLMPSRTSWARRCSIRAVPRSRYVAVRFLQTSCLPTKSIARRRKHNRHLLEAMEEHQATIDGEAARDRRAVLSCAPRKTRSSSKARIRSPKRSSIAFSCVRARRIRIPIKSARSSRVRPAVSTRAISPAAGVERRGERRARCSTRNATSTGIHVEPALQAYVLAIVTATRKDGEIALGASPRAGLALLARSARKCRHRRPRLRDTPDDVKDVAMLVLPHRLLVLTRSRNRRRDRRGRS